MKKFLSLIVAMVLLVGIFTTGAVAFAHEADLPVAEETDPANPSEDEQPERKVTFNASKFEEYVFNNHPAEIEMSRTFMLNVEWLNDAAKVNEIFEGIVYVLEEDEPEQEEQPADESEGDGEGDEEQPEQQPNDVIYVLYCSNTSDPRDDNSDWSVCRVNNTFSVTGVGYWGFRFAVVDGAKASVSGYSFNYDDVLATTYDNVLYPDESVDPADPEASAPKDLTLWSYSRDTTAPTASLSDSLKNKQEEGLTVGVNYTIPTSLTIEDCSSTTTTYVVYKQVGSDNGGDSDGWLQIYDSATREVAEGYENNISAGGVITPLESDVTGEYVYKIVYTVKDAYNFESVSDADKPAAFKPTLLLKVKPAEAEEKSPVDVWKIILYVIAGLSAVGIVVLLFVKPKQATDDGRYNASAANNSDNSDSSDVK